MHSQSYKLFYTFISAAALLAAFAFFVFGFSQQHADAAFLNFFFLYAFIFLNLGLLLIWQGWGLFGGLAFLGFCFVLVELISLRTNIFIYNFQILIMAALSGLSYIFYKKCAATALQDNDMTEKVEEEQNIANDRIRKDSELMQALYFRLDRYNMLKDLGEAFSAKLSLDDIYKLTIGRSCEIIGKYDEAKLFLITEGSHDLKLCALKNSDNAAKAPQEADVFDKWALNKRQPIHISDRSKDFRFSRSEYAEGFDMDSLIVVPLLIHKRIIGILRLGCKEAGAYSEDDLRLLDFISDMASAAINNARLYIRTQELAIHDSLTGLYVYRYFKERLVEELSRCRGENKPLSLMMLDIDHFKDYNDKYGHAAGDKVLKGVACIMRQNSSDAAIFSRYGGEEFAILLPGEDKNKVKITAEGIRKGIESNPFILRRQETMVTISIGAASFPEDASTEEELLTRADFLLYKAKKEGRNKVCTD